MPREIPYPHPGEILLEEFLKPMGISQYRLAKEIDVPQRRIGEIVAGKRAITVDTGLRLSAFFGTSDGFWSGLQVDYDTARTRDAISDTIERIVRTNAVKSWSNPRETEKTSRVSAV
ncbi:MAG: HigA family addiction module antidote protein [Candidatus Accumulibacter sp.]|jgi:addiction module HigA family antidote|nr:HigA family addiction module antidote protein [Accumulibacter sp.]